jgi:hypothetical protein
VQLVGACAVRDCPPGRCPPFTGHVKSVYLIAHTTYITITISSIHITGARIIKGIDEHCVKYNREFSSKYTLKDE